MGSINNGNEYPNFEEEKSSQIQMEKKVIMA
jgi:hypothetical protein